MNQLHMNDSTTFLCYRFPLQFRPFLELLKSLAGDKDSAAKVYFPVRSSGYKLILEVKHIYNFTDNKLSVCMHRCMNIWIA